MSTLQQLLFEILAGIPPWINAVAFIAATISFGVREWCDRKGYPYRRYSISVWPIILAGAGITLIYYWLETRPDVQTPPGLGRALFFLRELAFVHFNRGPLEFVARLVYWALKGHLVALQRFIRQ